jgi:hypothetical protein
MGYTTDFYGTFKVEPPLNEAEITYLEKFSRTRRMERRSGPYTTDSVSVGHGQEGIEDVINYNHPPSGQPGLWCQWTPSEDGSGIEWDGGEKFYYSAEWIAYLIEHFLMPDCVAKKAEPEKFKDFVPHTVSGQVMAEGEESGDIWQITVKDNFVTTQQGTITFAEPEPAVVPPAPTFVIINN